MKSALQPSPPPPVIDRSIAEVLEAVGRETGDLRGTAERLQHMAGELIDRARLAAAAPDAWRLDIADAVAPVFLADLAKRLCREHSHDAGPETVSGDCELF